ncbi:MAG: Ig-like domain-containing protein [Chloroflexota bacterium]
MMNLATNRNMTLFSSAITAVLLLSPIYSHAVIDWADGFEYANDAALGSVWSHSCLGNPGVSTLRPFSGSKSLRLVYRGHVGEDPGAGGCFIDRSIGGASDTAYFSVRIYLENFTPDRVSTKMIQLGQSCCYPNFWWLMGGGQSNLNMAVTSMVPSSFNIPGGSMPQNQWFCAEGRITMNTPVVAIGIVQSWINGVQQINRTDLMLRNATLTDKNGPNSRMDRIQLYTQNGLGVIYYDDLQVSRDARIECGSTPPPPVDTQAPSIQLTAPAAGATVSGSTVSITATASDNVGVAGVQFKIGTQNIGAEDTSAPYAATLNSTLFANGAHTLTAVARDAAGNSTTSAARSITISNATTPPVGVVGTVSNLSVASVGANSATLSFTEVTDGTGLPAKYDVRLSSVGALWGGAPPVAQGTCASPLAGTQIGATKTCTVLGLTPSTDYQFQLVPYRGTPNVDVVFGPLSNVAAARTSAGANVMPPAKPKNLRAQ